MNSLLDLRFVIGAFFTIIGLMVFAYGFTGEETAGSINQGCGILFLVFGVFMVLLSFKKDASDKVLDHDEQQQ